MASDTQPLAHALLQRALPPEAADRYYEERVVRRTLFLRPTSPEPSARATRRRILNEKKEKAKKRKNLKPRPLSAAKKRQLGLSEIPKEQRKWAIYEPLHNLWLGYMKEILGLQGVASGEKKSHVHVDHAGAMIGSADMHGAMLEVVRSRCVSRVGLKGIVVRDSQHVFEIITKGNVLKTIPKEHTIYRMEIPLEAAENVETPRPLVFEINGEQFQNRAPDRANKKYKMHYQPDR
ncbi:RNase P/MRP, p29 subunit [Aaosphaeria arxii CBS 175.79]|uniref:Ribonuclease P protein subunit n=1 Tax=Aaosphaeria arxii CBS 175.79 TaxID=1450172 RepID=A0A6A5XB15_9PLEO|nr:RNase P/MRP, p29 subunit [Aaosphaeria arxii CBS 175.79]KAF2010083.1 RNase P/MRP, p29 subunit [Aaosphaeria arxii CBS 175.79]